MLLRYPLHRLRLRLGRDPDRPVVGVKRRLAELQQRSQEHRLQEHGVGGQVSSEHLWNASVWSVCRGRQDRLSFTLNRLLSGYRFNMAAADRLQGVSWQLK